MGRGTVEPMYPIELAPGDSSEGYERCDTPDQVLDMGEFDNIPLKKIKAAFDEDILPADVDRKVAQGICTMVSPITYEDDEDGELEMLRTKFKRKIVGKMKGDQKVARGGHVKDFDLEDGNRVTLVWFDDDKLAHELDQCQYSMPLNIDCHYGEEENGAMPDYVKEYGVRQIGEDGVETKVEDDENPGFIDKILGFFETDQEVDYISAPFRWDKKELFAGIEDPDTFFRSSLRSFLTHHILIRTDVSKKKDIQDGINIRGLNYLKLKGVYTDVFILHDRPSTLHRRKAFKEKDEDQKVVDPRQELWDSWKQWYKFQPLWKIRNYFGEKIAFYFAWIGLYSESLIVPTILGIIVFFYGINYRWADIMKVADQYIDVIDDNGTVANSTSNSTVSEQIYEVFTIFNNPATPWFSLVLCLWATYFVEQWKRKSNSLKYEWDVSNFEQLEPDRPQFYGSKTRKNPITEEEEWFYPFYKLYMKLSISTITVVFMVLLVIASTLGIIVFRVASNASNFFGSNDDNNSLYTSFISSVLNATIIMLLGWGYEKLAYYLTDWENHRTQTAYDDALIIKLFAFQFVNNYASLCYIAFFKENVATNGMFGVSKYKDTCDYTVNNRQTCYPMLVMQVAVLLCMKPMPKFTKDVVIPYIMHQFRKFRNRFRNGDTKCCCCFTCCCTCIRPDNIEAIDAGPEKTKELLDIIEEDRRLIAGDVDFTLSEYTEKTIMYGMIVLFGAVFPLAPLIALVCNLIDIRVDAYRILWKNRRYIAQRAEDIGIWQYILEFLNMIGVIVNSLILAMTLRGNNSFLDAEYVTDRWMVAFAFEHAVFSIKFIVAYMIPDVPSDVQFKMRKEQFQVNQLFEKGPTRKASMTTAENGNNNNANV